MRSANLVLRFLMELCALGAFAYWGFDTGSGVLGDVALGLGAPLIAALTWGRFVAPKAATRLADPARLGLEVVFFGLAAGLLAAAGEPVLAAILAVLAIGTALLVRRWGEDFAV